jgi:hypothetical protein
MTAHEHVFDDLPGLLAGELGRAETGRVSAHLRACEDCRQELVLVVTAAAALRSAARFAPQAVMDNDDVLPDPTRFLAELAAEQAGRVGEGTHPRGTARDGTGLGGTAPPGPGLDGARPDGTGREGIGPDGTGREGGRDEAGDAERLPDLGDLGGPSSGTRPAAGAPQAETPQAGTPQAGTPRAGAPQAETPQAVRRGGGRSVPGHRPATGRRRAWWSAAAAAVLLVVGIGAGVLIGRDTTPHAPAGREVAMQPVGSWTATGRLTLRGNQVEVDPTNLAPAEPGHFYQVWLVNRNGPTPKLMSVGLLNPGGDTWTLPGSLLSAYTTVEVSYEADDGNTAYSGNSVLRGQYS